MTSRLLSSASERKSGLDRDWLWRRRDLFPKRETGELDCRWHSLALWNRELAKHGRKQWTSLEILESPFPENRCSRCRGCPGFCSCLRERRGCSWSGRRDLKSELAVSEPCWEREEQRVGERGGTLGDGRSVEALFRKRRGRRTRSLPGWHLPKPECSPCSRIPATECDRRLGEISLSWGTKARVCGGRRGGLQLGCCWSCVRRWRPSEEGWPGRKKNRSRRESRAPVTRRGLCICESSAGG